MATGVGRTARFGFRVGLEATVTVEATDGRSARDALGGLLDGSTARVIAGVGIGLEMADVRVSSDVVLVLVDGVEPLESLRSALARWRAAGPTDDGPT